MNIRQLLSSTLNVLMMLFGVFMTYKAWGLYTNCESPLVVVLSESMEPAFARGDILFLSNPKTPIEIGDICVFKIPNRDIPIVHRVLVNHDASAAVGIKVNANVKSKQKKKKDQQLLLTKGDNNTGDDRVLYQELYSNRQMMWVEPKHIVGRVQGHLPYIGMFTIYMTDYPMFKYALLGAIGLFAFLYD
ncbi:MAG: signal peptidase I [Benniella sp.]|nr:MAG: signal peptidase I [Benniella sp.]